MSLLQETKQFAADAHTPWRFDVFTWNEFAVVDNRGRIVHCEKYADVERRAEEALGSSHPGIGGQYWQEARIKWQFIVHASQLFPKMFADLDL